MVMMTVTTALNPKPLLQTPSALNPLFKSANFTARILRNATGAWSPIKQKLLGCEQSMGEWIPVSVLYFSVGFYTVL